MKFQGFIGAAYKLPSVNVDDQECINLFLETIQSGFGKEGQTQYLKSTDGLTKLFELGSGPYRLVYVDSLQKDDGAYFQKLRAFVVSGSKVYRLTYDSVSGWDTLLLGELGTSTGPVSAASTEIDYGVTVFVDGSAENYVYHKTTSTNETFQTFTAAGYSPVARATQVRWVDGYLVFNKKDSNTFYVSTWATISVAALDFASSEGDPDNIVAIIANHRDLWLLNERTVELFANTGNADFPFERVQGGFIENGCLAGFSVAKIGGVVCWLGRDESGQGIVYKASGPQHERISTHAIEAAIASYASPKDATAYAYQSGGHSFYVLNFAEATWVYDLTTGAWHRRAYLENGQLLRHRGECHAFFPTLGVHLVGDYQNAKLYIFDGENQTDDGEEIPRIRVAPHISNGGKELTFHEFKLDMETGIGLDGAAALQGNDPQVMMQFSDDGGHTWSNEKWKSAGKLGKKKTRVKWDRLGMARDRLFKIVITDPVKVTLINAELEVEAGYS